MHFGWQSVVLSASECKPGMQCAWRSDKWQSIAIQLRDVKPSKLTKEGPELPNVMIQVICKQPMACEHNAMGVQGVGNSCPCKAAEGFLDLVNGGSAGQRASTSATRPERRPIMIAAIATGGPKAKVLPVTQGRPALGAKDSPAGAAAATTC